MTLYDREYHEALYERSLRSARHVLRFVFEFVHPRSVVDFGCGLGAWLTAAAELGATELVGLDGSWVEPAAIRCDRARFVPVDLERGCDLDRRFDLAVSVEAAEHLDPSAAKPFVRDLCTAADVVLFGAATIGQGGRGHVNEQRPSYWKALFKEAGYEAFDIVRPRCWGDDRIDVVYRQNTLLFANPRAMNVDVERLARHSVDLGDVVHPVLFERRMVVLNRLLAEGQGESGPTSGGQQ